MLDALKSLYFRLGLIWGILIITDCRHIHEDAPACFFAIMAITAHVMVTLAGLAIARGHHGSPLTVAVLTAGVVGVVCLAGAFAHLKHLLPCTVFALNGCLLLMVAHELWDLMRSTQLTDV